MIQVSIKCNLARLMACAALACSTLHAAPPNIVFIIGDDMDRFMFNSLIDAGDPDALEEQIKIGFSGKPVLSPNLDRLANEGMTFPNQHVVTSVCTPSRYSVLTGRYASRATNLSWSAYDGMTYPYFNVEIQSQNVTLPGLLKAAGYRTGFVGKDHVHDIAGYDNSIPSNADPTDPVIKARLVVNVDAAEAAIRSSGFDFAASVYPKNPAVLPGDLAVHNMDWVAKGGVDFIDDCVAQHPGQPFFLYFSTTLTHAPNGAIAAWQSNPQATPRGFETFTSPLPARSTVGTRMNEAGLPIGRLDHLLWFDDAIGALIDRLEAHGLDDNTLIVFFNDHGVETGGKSGLYQHGAKSLSIAWKKTGFAGGASSDAVLSNTDFAPTLLDLAGVEVPFDHFDGRSFRPVLEGRADSIRESCYFEVGCGRAVLMDNWKYIALRWPTSIADPVGDGIGYASLKARSNLEENVFQSYPHYYAGDQLYDLTTDPGEQTNLASDPAHAKRLEQMKKELTKYLNPLPGPFGEFKTASGELKTGSVIQVR